jgi:hypothetical protein
MSFTLLYKQQEQIASYNKTSFIFNLHTQKKTTNKRTNYNTPKQNVHPLKKKHTQDPAYISHQSKHKFVQVAM